MKKIEITLTEEGFLREDNPYRHARIEADLGGKYLEDIGTLTVVKEYFWQIREILDHSIIEGA